ncbi:hypothetical protein ABTY96_22385 [Streptomyces sp. NPDC096057]|uniref:hypothetical protein n=1 Tax=Streptomyces sp. NPDC096057 TaxID=3155543 RepID=UPI00331CC384
MAMDTAAAPPTTTDPARNADEAPKTAPTSDPAAEVRAHGVAFVLAGTSRFPGTSWFPGTSGAAL